MQNRLIQKAFQAEWPLDKQMKSQLIEQSEEIVPILLHMIETGDKVTGADAIGILGAIGYPENELAIPTMVTYLGADINDPRFLGTLQVLFETMEPDVVVPHLIRALLDKGEPYHVVSANGTSWAEDVEEICLTISNELTTGKIDPAYVLRCCPAVNAILLQTDLALVPDRTLSALLAVIEQAGETVDYVIPSLLELINRTPESAIGKQARQLLTTFKPEVLAAYVLLLNLN